MGWESFGVVEFDLGPLLQGQTSVAKLKSAYNSLIIKAVTSLEKRHRVFVSQEPIQIRVTVF